ncbi:hypothetical protein J3E71DRAFT_175323 [Bipolaris maydis]|nr:hypothetical protein J3E71DRAFT_175323 [Bipolaris maydis]
MKQLPTKDKGKRVKWDDTTDAEREEDRIRQLERNASAFRRIARPRKNAHTMPAEAEKFKQIDQDFASIQVVEQPTVRSFVRIRHTLNYIDATTPDEQPRDIVYIELTHNNTTGPRSGNQRDIDYIPTHRVVDVTSSAWQSSLEKIFPQTTKVEKYYKSLYASVKHSGHRLYLITIKHNERHSVTNLLTHKEDMLPLQKDLSIIAKASPMVFILVRGSGIPEQVEGLVQRFKDLTRYNPLNEFIVNLENPSLTDKGIKPNNELPKFTALVQYQFDTWEDLSYQIAIGALIEQRFSMKDQVYEAKAAVVPVPGTYQQAAKAFLSYHLQVSVTPDPSKPRLMPGDTVQVDLAPKAKASANSAHTWHGRVTEPTEATGMGMINVVVERPWKDNKLLDTKEYSALTTSALSKMSAQDLRRWSQANCDMDIKIFTKNSDKECKRIMNNINAMLVPEKLQEAYAEKEQRLSAARKLLQCGDHTQSAAVPLYQNVTEPFRQAATEFIQGFLRSHQLELYQDWLNNGIYDDTIWLTGPSGSGKTYLAIATLLPYLGENQDKPEDSNNPGESSKELEVKDESEESDNELETKDESKESDKKKKKKKIDVDVPDPEKSSNVVIERGRITIAAMQNEAVDSQYQLFSAMARQYAENLGIPRPLVLRLHSKESEINAVKAMTRPSYSPTGEYTRFNVDPTTNLTDELPLSLLNAYLDAYRGGSPCIADRRFKQLPGSAAKYILELARFRGFNLSSELRATFSATELKDLERLLKPIVDAHKDLRANDDELTRDIKIKIARAAKLGLDILIERAAVICTTVSVATTSSFNLLRRAHAVALEEAGRANDSETMGFFAHYWNVDLRMMIGATNQLRPIVFGDSRQNPFQKITAISTISRIESTGGNVSRLEASSRYHNQILFDLCAAVNKMPKMKPVDGAFDDALSKEYADINESIWNINTNLMFINTMYVTIQQNANRSTYCLETAAVAIKDAVERMAFIDGKDHVIITPYTAQVMVLRRERDYAAYLANVRRQHTTAKKLMDIEIVTIDSFMGKDRKSVTVDTAGVVGHLFEYGRTVVATTRARTSCQLIGPTLEYTKPTSKIGKTHPLANVIRQLDDTHRIKALTEAEIHSFEQYHTAMNAVGLGTDEEPEIYKKASTVAAVIYNEEEHDETELEIIKLMKQLKPDMPEPTYGPEWEEKEAEWGSGNTAQQVQDWSDGDIAWGGDDADQPDNIAWGGDADQPDNTASDEAPLPAGDPIPDETGFISFNVPFPAGAPAPDETASISLDSDSTEHENDDPEQTRAPSPPNTDFYEQQGSEPDDDGCSGDEQGVEHDVDEWQ